MRTQFTALTVQVIPLSTLLSLLTANRFGPPETSHGHLVLKCLPVRSYKSPWTTRIQVSAPRTSRLSSWPAKVQLPNLPASFSSQVLLFPSTLYHRLFNNSPPGGPGGSGVDLLQATQSVASSALGDSYNIVSFDPRGVKNSGPHIDCFKGAAEARATFFQLHSSGITNLSTDSVQKQYYSGQIFGDRCNDAVTNGDSPHGYYVATPAVAQDLLSFVEAEAQSLGRSPAEAKLWAYGVSYGTVLGATFASMFPDRVGRMVLDGVVDAEQYYHNDWRDNVDQMDATIEKFASLCHAAGSDKCSFWGPTPEDILNRLDKILRDLQNHPVPLSGLPGKGLPALVTVSDLKAQLFNALYLPLQLFPVLADNLHQLEHSNASSLAGKFAGLAIPDDPSIVIRCADSYRRNRLATMDGLRRAVENATSRSKYLGDLWIIAVESVLCWSVKPQLPDSMVVRGKLAFTHTPLEFITRLNIDVYLV